MFTDVFGKVDTAILETLGGGIANLMSIVSPILLSGFTVYLLFLFVSYWTANLEDTAIDLFKKGMAWFVILSLALNIATYNEYITPTVMGLGDMLSKGLNGQANASVLDTMSNSMVDIVTKNQDEANKLPITSVGRFIMIIIYNAIIIISFSVFLVVSASYILLAKVFLGILALIGPLFISLALFPATRQYFTAWVNQVVNYGLLLFLMNITASFMIKIFGEVINFSSIEYPVSNTFLIGVVLLSFMFFVILLKLPELASGLAGGITADGFAQAGRTIRSVTSSKQPKKDPKDKDKDNDNTMKPEKDGK